MKAVKWSKNIALILTVALFGVSELAAQQTEPKKRESVALTETKSAQPKAVKIGEENTDEANKTETSTPDAKADDKKMTDEEAAVLSYYSNYLSEYRLGPNDVISVEVFGQCPDYCKENITVPPTAKVSYPLIREGVMVGGKTSSRFRTKSRKSSTNILLIRK
jgi:hypothetical protein